MSYLEHIILLLYFPQFSSPNNSRFESFFLSIVKGKNTLPLFFPKIIGRIG